MRTICRICSDLASRFRQRFLSLRAQRKAYEPRTSNRWKRLGDLRVAIESDPADVGGPQQRLVLALLMAAAPDPVSIDSLIFSIWEDAPLPTARRTVCWTDAFPEDGGRGLGAPR